MYFGTLFLRNRPALELMRRLADGRPSDKALKVVVLGCSIGAEVYSILWALRADRPDRKVLVHAVDLSPDVLSFAEKGVYDPQSSDTAESSIFERLTDDEMQNMFDWEGDRGRIRSWLTEGITWTVGDACDPELVSELGVHDIVVASNFLCHMDVSDAERCLRNLARLASPGGYLFISGVDLDARTKIARELRWRPVPDLLSEMHDGDPLVRDDWPWQWWGLEPLNRNMHDWETRYASAFQVGSSLDSESVMIA